MFTAVLGAGALAVVQAQNPNSFHFDSARVTATQSQGEAQAQPQPKVFTGVIAKEGNRFVLRDATAKVEYGVDDENKVKDYVGKTVKVTGTLDAATNTIYVESIEIVT